MAFKKRFSKRRGGFKKSFKRRGRGIKPMRSYSMSRGGIRL